MCGIAGFLRTAHTPDRESHKNLLEKMGDAIIHRGPDAGGTFIDDAVALAHRRLSILDLSAAGNQPMASASGRFQVVFNGEIYNFLSVREELKASGYVFSTGTDTEVLLAAYEEYGERCVERLNGMFAFAIWDASTRELFIARDRLGKKPLYVYQANGHFAFASEIKALLALPFVERKIQPDAVADFFAYQYVPDPKTIFQNIRKLPPGHYLKTRGDSAESVEYWDVDFSGLDGRSESSIREELLEIIDDAVKLRMISDVPLGAFLSGGVDSSAIVGLMAKHSDTPVTTCSIGFDAKEFDEVHFARNVAQQFQTDHHEFTVKEDVATSLQQIARFFDEPFADPSFVPTFFVSQLARKRVTVALAGDGGDENFAGYSKYYTDSVENQIRDRVPVWARESIAPLFASIAGRFAFSYARKAATLFRTLSQSPDEAFFATNCFFHRGVWQRVINDDFARKIRDYNPAEVTVSHYRNAQANDHLSRILYTDIKTYLPGDILVKVDRMSMANSLETRAPLLDYRVVEFAAKIPSAMKLNGREKKYILKKSFEGFLTQETLYRKKMGFSVPLAHWLRNQLRPICAEAFEHSSSGLAQFFNMSEVMKLWNAHLAGNDQFTQELWSFLAFELWWKQYGVGAS